MNGDAVRRSGGRPTAEAAEQLEAAILDQATVAFLADGYAATTIEAIAKTCRVAKRTIYVRWSGKPPLFKAVLERLIAKWMADSGVWPHFDDLETALDVAATSILDVALTPEAIALHRLLVAEGGRFPELPLLLYQAGAAEGTGRIAGLLDVAVTKGTIAPIDTKFAAEQFLHLLLAGPQRRALGLGPRLDEEQVADWRRRSIALFLSGIKR